MVPAYPLCLIRVITSQISVLIKYITSLLLETKLSLAFVSCSTTCSRFSSAATSPVVVIKITTFVGSEQKKKYVYGLKKSAEQEKIKFVQITPKILWVGRRFTPVRVICWVAGCDVRQTMENGKACTFGEQQWTNRWCTSVDFLTAWCPSKIPRT